MTLIDEEILNWIERHSDDDPMRLRLKYAGDADLADAITQIECRRSARKKLPRLLENKRFWFPSVLAAEQCTSEQLADFHATLINKGERVVDLTCGLGVDAFALSRVASHVTAVEIDEHKAEVARHNADALDISNIDIINADCSAFVTETADRYDMAFIDPARRSASGGRVYALKDCQPDVVAMLDDIRRIANRLIIKVSPMLDITRLVSEMQDCTVKVIALGTRSECRELVAVVDFNPASTTSSPFIEAVTIIDNQPITFAFQLTQEQSAPLPEYAQAIGEGQYLYEPWPSVMKAGPFKLLAHRCGVKKLSADTHLYISDETREFPGDIYRVIESGGMDKRYISHLAKTYPAISVATRGLGITADDLRRRLKLKEGGTLKLLGVTIAGKRTLIVCDKSSAIHNQ